MYGIHRKNIWNPYGIHVKMQYFSVPHPFCLDSSGLQWSLVDLSQKCKWSPVESSGVQLESGGVWWTSAKNAHGVQ